MRRTVLHAGDFWGAIGDGASRPVGMPDPLAVALGLREHGDSFPGLEQYGQATLELGLAASLSFGRLRALLARFGSENPSIQVRFVEGDGADLVAAVAASRLDLAFVQADTAPAASPSEPLWAERLLVALPEQHPLARENALSREALRGERFLAAPIQGDDAATARWIERVLDGPPASLLCAPVQRETLMSLVALGHGLAIAPANALGAFYPGVAYRPFDGRQAFLPLHGAWRPDNAKPELRSLLGLIRSNAAGAAR